MNKELRLTDFNFKTEALESKMPVLVDFWGSWCPACKMMEPVIQELSQEYDGKIKIGKLNVDQNNHTATNYKINGVPTFIILNSGKIISRRTGAQSKLQLKQMLEEAGINLS
jgi:thioredoxin 1